MQVNDIIHGFRVLSKRESDETDSTAYLMEHEKSGARLFYLENEDDNKVFSISFRTPPTDDTGVAHIVEHSTLCGSRKYPLKEPFVELVKGSLNTFLNAMTYPDKTMYPVASRNDKDFQNLMDVYLDAVFYPAMRENPQVLMQEGWHYEIAKKDEPLKYSGVVYNEMKGALSSPDDLMNSRIMAALYPDTTYHYESGGDPEAIPQLTQEKFIAFHSKYYHPSNSYIYLYGDMNIEEKLKYLDEEYLSHFDRIDVPSQIGYQEPFHEVKRVTEHYPVNEGEDMKEKTFLSLNWVVGSATDVNDMVGLSILDHALLRTPSAPLRKILVDAGLGKDVDSSFEDEMLQPYFSIIINNSEADRVDKFYQLVMDSFKKIADEGIDRTQLEASLNLLEFRLRESDFGSAPKGLIYGIRAMRTWLYDEDPLLTLNYEPILKQMREGLDNGYFEDLIRRYFLNNKHQLLFTLVPSTTMAKEREEAQAKELAAKKAQMSDAEIESIIAATKALKVRQQTPDSPEALKTIPVLQLSDIRKEVYDLPLEERMINGTDILFSDVETNGIVYLNLLFDARTVPQADLPYLYMLRDMIGLVDTESHSYAELANLINLHTGGISYEVAGYTKKDDADSFMPKFRIKAKVLKDKLPELLKLLQEILLTSRFTDAKRVKELMEQAQTTAELSLQRSAHQIVASRIGAYLSPAGAYADLGGLPLYRFVQDYLENFDEKFPELQDILAELMQKVFNTNNLIVSVTEPDEDYDAFDKSFASFQTKLSHETYPLQTYQFELGAKNEGLTSSSRVQYVGKGANFRKLGFQYTGAMHVLETLLRYDYFWTKVRVQGGAYGAFTSFKRNGMMYFGSYRDPNLKETLDVFDKTGDYARHFTASDREMDKFIIGTMSGVDTPMTPQMKGNTAAVWHLRGITKKDRQQTRDEILATRQEDIQALAPLIDACMQQNVLCVFGGQEKIEENKDLFGTVKPAL